MAVSSGDEDNIALAGIGIVVLQEEDFVYSIVLESREFDKQTDWACEIFLYHEILLAADLVLDLAAIETNLTDGSGSLLLQEEQEDPSSPCH